MTTTLAADVWRARRRAHEQRVDDWLRPHLARRRAGVKHPVEDFLFTYYAYRPARLRRWHPGPGIVAEGADPQELGPGYVAVPGGAAVDTAAVLARRGEAARRIAALLTLTASRAPNLGCFGMHEWAMVYRQTPQEVRHNEWPLRLSPDGVVATVAERGLRCSHFDAYRFFTEPARPLNLLRPTRERQHELEQPGCLHANMDLYKWAHKLSPLVGAELTADCFELARDIRVLDMRASPYDLTGLGVEPIRVETPDGRAEYIRQQREFAGRAAPLRERLIDACTSVQFGR